MKYSSWEEGRWEGDGFYNISFSLKESEMDGQFTVKGPDRYLYPDAEKICQDMGAILAPLKTKAAVDAVSKHFEDARPEDSYMYYLTVGLKQEGEKHIWTDGTYYNATTERKLFKGEPLGWLLNDKRLKGCEIVVLYPGNSQLYAHVCYRKSIPLCYKPSSSVPPKGGFIGAFSTTALVSGAVGIVLLLAVAVIAFFLHRKRKRACQRVV